MKASGVGDHSLSLLMVRVMGLREAVQHFQTYLTIKAIASKLGVSKGQVMKYASGATKSCNDAVVDKFYDHFTIDGLKVLLDYYPSEEVYLETRKVRDDT
jgi:transcriptional regulator with XRE-family HTH domain